MSDTFFSGLPNHEERVLVEDNPDDAFLVELEFKRNRDCRLCIVRDGQQAIDYMAGRQPYNDRDNYPLPEVILLDLKMPRRDGFDVLKWLRTKAGVEVGFTPVIVMSSSDSVEDARRAYELGANLYMNKPVAWERLREGLRLLGIFWCEYAGNSKSASARPQTGMLASDR